MFALMEKKRERWRQGAEMMSMSHALSVHLNVHTVFAVQAMIRCPPTHSLDSGHNTRSDARPCLESVKPLPVLRGPKATRLRMWMLHPTGRRASSPAQCLLDAPSCQETSRREPTMGVGSFSLRKQGQLTQ